MRITPNLIIETIWFLKHRKHRLPSSAVYKNIIKEKSGIEIGGPSTTTFTNILPIYQVISNLDCVNFSSKTLWEASLHEGKLFNYYKNKSGKQFISDATDLKNIKSDSYDFVLSSNCLEHIANPLKALEEWTRVVYPNGYIILVLPNKNSNFDHKRTVTSYEHILEDYKSDISEHDLSHLNEILELHDLSRDLPAGNYENFKDRCMNNFVTRGLHHHVFDLPLIKTMFSNLNIELIHMDETETDYFAVGCITK